MESNNIKAEISGRPKHIYSIFKKMTQKGKPFDLVRDVREALDRVAALSARVQRDVALA